MVELETTGREETSPRRPHIGVVYAGGTISSIQTRFGYREGGHIRNLVEILQDRHPDFVANRFTLGQPQIAYTGLSENMTEQNRQNLTDILEGMVDSGSYDAVLVTHGTDSFELSAKFAKQRESLIRKIRAKGVRIIFTAAEHDIDEPETDVWNNLMDSLNVAASPLEPDIWAVFHKKVIPAEFVVKQPYNGTKQFSFMDSRGDEYAEAFVGAQERSALLADQLYQHFHGKSLADEITDEEFERRLKALETGTEEDVAIPTLTQEEIEAFAQMGVMSDPTHKVFEYRVNLDRSNHFDMAMALKEIWLFPEVQAVLLTLYHSGTANTVDPNSAVTDIIRGLRERRAITFFAVTENHEPVDLHAYETSVALRKAGTVPLYDMPYHPAMVKLWWAVEQTKNPAELIDLMLTNLVGEIDESRIYREDIEELKQIYTASSEPIQRAYAQREGKSFFWESYFRK